MTRCRRWLAGAWLLVAATVIASAAPPPDSRPGSLVRKKPAEVFNGEALSLPICYELALLRMETIGLSEEDVRTAQARYREAIGAILPSVKVVGEQYFYKDRATTSDLGLGGTVVGSDDLQPRTARVNVKVPIFSGLRDIQAARALRAEIAGSRESARRVRQNLYLSVAESYYQTISYEEDLLILNDVVKSLDSRIAVLEKWVRLGRSRDSELLQSQTTLAQTRVSIERTKKLMVATREMLAFYIGVPSSRWSLQPDAAALPDSLVMGEYLAQSANRPDVLAAVELERSARARLSAAKGEHFPKLSFDGNYAFYNSDTPGQTDWSGFLTLEIPIFEGGSIEARVDQNKSLFAQRKLDLSQLQREAERDVRTAFDQFNASLAELARLREAVATANLNYRAQEADYNLHVVNNIDVLDALQTLHNLRREEASARANTRLNLIRLYVAAGVSK